MRSLWDGELRLARNYEQPLFPTGRQGLLETVNPGFYHNNGLWLAAGGGVGGEDRQGQAAGRGMAAAGGEGALNPRCAGCGREFP
jgi:hypothetical protein